VEGLIVLAIVIAALVTFGLAALAFGTDSREGLTQRRAIIR
jgi:hypothetical protein